MTNSLDWMLWYEKIPKNEFAEALKRASQYYQQKYGHWPNRVQLPPAWEQEANAVKASLESAGKNGIEMETRKNVLHRHLKVVFDPQKETI